MDAFTLAARLAADVDFVNLYVIATGQIATDRIAVRPHHASAELVQNLERGFIPAKADLPLQLNGRYAGRQAGNEAGRPKPRCERRMRPLHHRADRQGRLLATGAAGQYLWPTRQVQHRLALFVAMRALKAFRPLSALKPLGTCRIIREQSLKVPERLRKWQVFPLVNIVRGHGLRSGFGYGNSRVLSMASALFLRILRGIRYRCFVLGKNADQPGLSAKTAGTDCVPNRA